MLTSVLYYLANGREEKTGKARDWSSSMSTISCFENARSQPDGLCENETSQSILQTLGCAGDVFQNA